MSLKKSYTAVLKYLIYIGVLFILQHPLYSQEPSYIRIGQEELADLEIYSIIQDDNGYIWLSTNRDLIKYDGYTFQHISNNTTGTKSLFGLTNDNYGNLFCFSLGGEIFTIKNDSLSLYFVVPDSLHNIEQTIFFDEQNNLNVCGKHVFKITPDLKIKLIYDQQGKPASTITGIKTHDGKYIIGGVAGNQIGYIVNDKVKPYEVIQNHNDGFFPINNSTNTYLQVHNQFKLFVQQKNGFEPIPINTNKIPLNTIAAKTYILNNNTFWISTRAGGVYAFDKNGEQMYNGNKILSSYYISAYLQDREGNYWFTTLGKGLIYIQNPAILSFQNHNILKNEVITTVTAGDGGDMFLGCEGGSVIKKTDKGDIEYIATNLGKKITLLKYFSAEGTLAFENNEGLLFFNPKTKKIKKQVKNTASVKDIISLENDNWLIGTSYGIINTANTNLNIKLNRRISHLYYHFADSSKWIISPTGLFYINKNNTVEELNTWSTFPIDIDGNNDKIWIATAENGIVGIKNKKIIQHLNTTNGLLSNQIRKIMVRNNLLFITHELGIQIYDITKKTYTNIDMSDGILSNYIIDLEYKNDVITLVTRKGVQEIRLSQLVKNNTPPIIRINAVKINNQLTNLTNTTHSGKHNQSIEIFFTPGAYQHQGKLKYVYRLKGKSNIWDTTSFNQNHVKYEPLQPGKYTFEVKAINENNISSEIIKYEYTVIPPIWQRWWFYLIVAFLVIITIIGIYKLQLNRIQKKNLQKNELISSRLTALKSQMNPHFIFNALNSIQDLVLKQETEKSYDYIVKFSDLVRQTLNYSDKDFIDFEDELKLLNVYLELEQLRFQDKFTYSIDKINIEEIEVPPMLVQPFVENAIKHGLLHKTGEKKLHIVFEQTDVLTCTITDNGIGRNKAREIKERQNKAHESFSVQAIKSRFEIMQDLYKSTLGVEYEDLYENNIATGTKVILRLPFKPQY